MSSLKKIDKIQHSHFLVIYSAIFAENSRIYGNELFQELYLAHRCHQQTRAHHPQGDKRPWYRSPINECGEKDIPERTFHNHIDSIYDIFGLEIKCDRSLGYDLQNHHHALADAEACAYIAMKIL